jgi:hypothetical protein
MFSLKKNLGMRCSGLPLTNCASIRGSIFWGIKLHHNLVNLTEIDELISASTLTSATFLQDMAAKLVDHRNNEIDQTKYSVGELYCIAHLWNHTHQSFYVGIQQLRESRVSQSVEVFDNHMCSAVPAIVGHLECVVHSKL